MACRCRGVTVTATQGEKKVSAVTDTQGSYFFSDLADGTWKISVEMRFFKPAEQTVEVKAGVAATAWTLEMMTKDQILGQATAVAAPTTGGQAAPGERDGGFDRRAGGSQAGGEGSSEDCGGWCSGGCDTSARGCAQAFGWISDQRHEQ